MKLEILNIMKPDLKEVRTRMANDVRRLRKTDKAKAKVLMARLKRGMEATEAALQSNLWHGPKT